MGLCYGLTSDGIDFGLGMAQDARLKGFRV